MSLLKILPQANQIKTELEQQLKPLTPEASNLIKKLGVARDAAETPANKDLIAKLIARISNQAANPNEIQGVKIEGLETLNTKQKAALTDAITSQQTLLKNSVENSTLDAVLERSFGREVDDPVELQRLKKAVLKGEWDKVIPKIKLAGPETFDTAKDASGTKVQGFGAYTEDKNTIILNTKLLDGPQTLADGSKITAASVLTEEIGHSFDARLNEADSQGDEGRIFALAFEQQSIRDGSGSFGKPLAEIKRGIIDEQIDQERAQNDKGTLLVDGKEVEVEFIFGIGRAFKKAAKSVGKAIKGTVKGVVNTVKSFVKNPLDTVKNFVKNPVNLLSAATAFIPGLNFLTPALNAFKTVSALKDKDPLAAIAGLAGGIPGLPQGGAINQALDTAASFANRAQQIVSNPLSFLPIPGLQNAVQKIQNIQNTKDPLALGGQLLTALGAGNGNAGQLVSNTQAFLNNPLQALINKTDPQGTGILAKSVRTLTEFKEAGSSNSINLLPSFLAAVTGQSNPQAATNGADNTAASRILEKLFPNLSDPASIARTLANTQARQAA